jgi:hypothetical protein
VGDPVDDDPGFAASGPGQYEEAPFRAANRFLLRLI